MATGPPGELLRCISAQGSGQAVPPEPPGRLVSRNHLVTSIGKRPIGFLVSRDGRPKEPEMGNSHVFVFEEMKAPA